MSAAAFACRTAQARSSGAKASPAEVAAFAVALPGLSLQALPRPRAPTLPHPHGLSLHTHAQAVPGAIAQAFANATMPSLNRC